MDIDIESIGEDIGLLDGIRSTRAIRRLRPEPVPTELIRKVCEAGTFAPSGGNRQPWLFIAVMDKARREHIARLYNQTFTSYIQPALKAAEDPDYPPAKRKNMKAAMYLASHLHEVPVHLFVAGWKRRGEPQTQALFPAIQNVLLACRAVGLGASLTTAHRAHQKEIDEMLGLAEDTPSCALIPIGWPRGKFGRPSRRSIDECLYFERFDGESSKAHRQA